VDPSWIGLLGPGGSSVDTCYITGFYTGAGGTGSPVIVATKDGGKTWVSQPYSSSIQLTTLTAVRCATADDCWTVGSAASGPVVLATSDGGATWSSQNYPGGQDISVLTDLSCPHSPSPCWMVATVGGDPKTGAGSQPMILAAKQPST
jgi:hypothetical protein